MSEVVLRGAVVADGTGGPTRRADVTIAGSRIVDVGPESRRGCATLDLGGLVLAPGFIDVHTHYDAQVLWDGGLTPSCWHGVTTALLGNCGYTLAPVRADHRRLLLQTLQLVEGMSLEALEAGVTWEFETFPEYLDVIRRRPLRVNVGVLLGHTALRYYVLGEDASDRVATAEEIATMRSIVADAARAGGLGFSTSRAGHVGANGKPVPSRAAEDEELLELVQGLKDAGRGVIQMTDGRGPRIELFAELSRRAGRPLTWTPLLTGLHGGHGTGPRLIEESAQAGGQLFAQISNLPHVFEFELQNPGTLAMGSPAFREASDLDHAGRVDLYRDHAWRTRVADQLPDPWPTRIRQAVVERSVTHAELIGGPTIEKIAAQRGVSELEAMIDISLEDDLRTVFSVPTFNDDLVELEELLRDRRTLLGLGDGGAHVSQICDSGYPSQLLGYWVRERGVLSLEDAIWRLAGQPAEFLGLRDRGVIEAGRAADLVAFDPDRIDHGPLTRVADFPAGTDRLISRPAGMAHIWVNGERILCDGVDVDGVAPGELVTDC